MSHALVAGRTASDHGRNRELVKALNSPEVKEQLAKHFLEPNPSSREDLAAYIKRDFDTWARVIKAAGITAN